MVEEFEMFKMVFTILVPLGVKLSISLFLGQFVNVYIKFKGFEVREIHFNKTHKAVKSS